MVVGCLDGISFSSGVLPGSRVEAGEGVTTGNQITNQLPADYAIAYKVNETPSAVNVPIGDKAAYLNLLLGEKGYVTTQEGTENGNHEVGKIAYPLTGASYSYSYYDKKNKIEGTIEVPATPGSDNLGESSIRSYFEKYRAAKTAYNTALTIKNTNGLTTVLENGSNIPDSIPEPVTFTYSYNSGTDTGSIRIDTEWPWNDTDTPADVTFTCRDEREEKIYNYAYYDIVTKDKEALSADADAAALNAYKVDLNKYIATYQGDKVNSNLQMCKELSITLTPDAAHTYQIVQVLEQKDVTCSVKVNANPEEESGMTVADFLTTYAKAKDSGNTEGWVFKTDLHSDLSYGQYHYVYENTVTNPWVTKTIQFKTANYETELQKYKALVQEAANDGAHIKNVDALKTELRPLISYRYSYYASTQKVKATDDGFATAYVEKKLASVGDGASVDILKDLSSGQLTYTWKNYDAPQIETRTFPNAESLDLEAVKTFFETYNIAKNDGKVAAEDNTVQEFVVNYSYDDTVEEGGRAHGVISYDTVDTVNWNDIESYSNLTLSVSSENASCSYNYIKSEYTEEPVTISLVGEDGTDVSSAVNAALVTYKVLLNDGKIVEGKELQLDLNSVNGNDFFYFKNKNDSSETEVSFNDFGENSSSNGFGGNNSDVALAIKKYNELSEYGAVSKTVEVSTPEGQYSFANLPTIYKGEVVVYQVSLATDEKSQEFISYLEHDVNDLNNGSELISKRDETGTLDKFYSVETSNKYSDVKDADGNSTGTVEERVIQTDFTLNYQATTKAVKLAIDTDGAFQNEADHLPTQIQVQLKGAKVTDPNNNSEEYFYSLSLYPKANRDDAGNITGYTYEDTLNIPDYVNVTEMTVTQYRFGSQLKNPDAVGYLTYASNGTPAEDDVYRGILSERTADIIFATGTDETVTNMPAGTAVFLGKNFVLPVNVPVRKGYEFAGWKFGKQTYQPGDSLWIEQSILDKNDTLTFTAAWTPHTYTVTYKGMDNVSDQDDTSKYPTEFTYVKEGKFEVGIPAKSKYIFAGWEAKGATIANKSDSDLTAIVPKDEQRNITLTATWRNASIVEILYEGMEESQFVNAYGSAAERISFYQEETEQLIPAAKRTGYIFKGWIMRADGVETQLPYNGETESTEIPKITCNKELVLQAIWEAREYSITYKLKPYWEGDNSQTDDSQSVGNTTTHTYDTETTIAAPTNTDKYYKFAGWEQAIRSGVEKNLTIGERDYTSAITLTSTWEPETWEIKYSAGKDTDDKEVTDAAFAADNPEEYLYATAFKTENSNITNQITNPVREGYKFTGWTVQQQYQVFVPKVTRERVGGIPLLSPEYEYMASETEGTWKTVTVNVDASQLLFTGDTYTDITENRSAEKIGEELHSGNLQIKGAFVVENDETAGIASSLTQEQLKKMYDGEASYCTQNTKAKLILTANWEPYEYHLVYNVDYTVDYAQNNKATANTYNGRWGSNAGWTPDNAVVSDKDNKKVVKQYASALKLIGFDDATRPVVDHAMTDLVSGGTGVGYSFIGWSDTKPNYVLSETDAKAAGGVTAQPEEKYYIQAGYYKTGDDSSITYTRTGRYNGDTLNLYAVFERDVQLNGTIRFEYTNTSIYDETLITADGSQKVTELKLTVKRINVLTGQEDKTWTPAEEYGGKKTKTIPVTMADGQTGTATYSFGTYPRADENGIYRYEITAEPIKNYVEERTLTIYPGEVNFTETYAPDRFQASWNIALVQGTADTEDIPAAIQIMPTYLKDGEWVDVET